MYRELSFLTCVEDDGWVRGLRFAKQPERGGGCPTYLVVELGGGV
jgi:hypothetical protein